MNVFLTLIILGLIIMHFGFWASIGAFFVTIFWIIIVILIIFAAFIAIGTLLDNLR